MKKILASAVVLAVITLGANAAQINVTNVVTITANTNVQATLKQWLDANVVGAGSNYVARFQIAAGQALTNWVRRVWRDQDAANQNESADAIIKSNATISPVGP